MEETWVTKFSSESKQHRTLAPDQPEIQMCARHDGNIGTDSDPDSPAESERRFKFGNAEADASNVGLPGEDLHGSQAAEVVARGRSRSGGVRDALFAS